MLIRIAATLISICAGSTVLAASTNEFVIPCADHGKYLKWLGRRTPKGGPHLGHDYGVPVGTPVRAIADGEIVFASNDVNGFGGLDPSKPGPMMWIRHRKENGRYFYALYGHIVFKKSNGQVQRGEILGTVISLYVGKDLVPHLHLGIWDSETSPPMTELGYGPIRSFIDPRAFIREHRPYAGEAVGNTPPSAASQTVLTLKLPGNVPLALVLIKAGSFQMGSPEDENSRWEGEGARHRVTIARNYYVGRTEVTQRQWRAVMNNNPAHSYGVGDNYPIYNVSWNDIAGSNGFLDKLNKHLSASAQNVTVHLPSEAQWEYACRAGTTTRWYFGDSLEEDDLGADAPAGVMPGNRSDYMWFNTNSNVPFGSSASSTSNPSGKIDPKRPRGPHQVGLLRPNGWGLYDMSGNVAEWCQDWYHEDYVGAPVNESAWLKPATSERVTRGGSWSSKFLFYTRSAHRFHAAPEGRFPYLGFRLATVVDQGR